MAKTALRNICTVVVPGAVFYNIIRFPGNDTNGKRSGNGLEKRIFFLGFHADAVILLRM
jgi:hypothetical protein